MTTVAPVFRTSHIASSTSAAGFVSESVVHIGPTIIAWQGRMALTLPTIPLTVTPCFALIVVPTPGCIPISVVTSIPRVTTPGIITVRVTKKPWLGAMPGCGFPRRGRRGPFVTSNTLERKLRVRVSHGTWNLAQRNVRGKHWPIFQRWCRFVKTDLGERILPFQWHLIEWEILGQDLPVLHSKLGISSKFGEAELAECVLDSTRKVLKRNMPLGIENGRRRIS
mmetsp:Transcript_17563/g.41378  ORF Transcript_17563/g.41378 Transcript_17563/m.41378 type:complete len:224 (+) Transcript_17563:391-1062(+)